MAARRDRLEVFMIILALSLLTAVAVILVSLAP